MTPNDRPHLTQPETIGEVAKHILIAYELLDGVHWQTLVDAFPMLDLLAEINAGTTQAQADRAKRLITAARDFVEVVATIKLEAALER